MTSFRLSPLAEIDLEEIVDYVATEWSADRADALLDAILAAAALLAEMPGIGHSRRDLTDEDVRFWAVHSYLVVYAPETRPLEIVRVLHGARGPDGLRRDIEAGR